MFLKLGYDGAIDTNDVGIIHENETTQAVFFTIGATKFLFRINQKLESKNEFLIVHKLEQMMDKYPKSEIDFPNVNKSDQLSTIELLDHIETAIIKPSQNPMRTKFKIRVVGVGSAKEIFCGNFVYDGCNLEFFKNDNCGIVGISHTSAIFKNCKKILFLNNKITWDFSYSIFKNDDFLVDNQINMP